MTSSHPSEAGDDDPAPDATTEDQSADVRDEVVESGPVAGAPDPDSGGAAEPKPDLVPGQDHVEAAGRAESARQVDPGGASSQGRPSAAAVSTAHRWSERAKGSVRPLEVTSRSAQVEEPPDDGGEWDDTVVEESNESPIDLIMRELGGVVIDTDGDSTAR